MAQWHLAPGSFSWQAAAAALADGRAAGVSPPVTDRNDPIQTREITGDPDARP